VNTSLAASPAFPSTTKDFGHYPGLDFVRQALAETSLPLFVIGGINARTADQATAAGATQLVVGSATWRPDGNYATGVLGKWKFVPELGAFIALDNFASATGDAAVWIYKPIGWQNPGGNTPPTVTLTSPANGTSVAAPAAVVVSANASDSDGSVSRVDFFACATLIGSDTTAPYSITWSNVAAGSYALTAVAVDNGGASKTSSPVTLTVTAGATVTLQDGLNGYTGTRDAYLSMMAPQNSSQSD